VNQEPPNALSKLQISHSYDAKLAMVAVDDCTLLHAGTGLELAHLFRSEADGKKVTSQITNAETRVVRGERRKNLRQSFAWKAWL
jgi:hypothetical protein